jgi:hypothetical protein
MERKYRELCEKLGISSSLNFTRAEDRDRYKLQLSPTTLARKKAEKDNILLKNDKYFGYQIDEEDKQDAKLEVSSC